MLDHSDYNNDQTERDNHILAAWPSFSEIMILESFANNPAYNFRRCADHGLYAYQGEGSSGACPRTNCGAHTVAIPNPMAFAARHKIDPPATPTKQEGAPTPTIKEGGESHE